ncbi:hypothetical protein SLA2020_268680 [Shorea laevis]
MNARKARIVGARARPRQFQDITFRFMESEGAEYILPPQKIRSHWNGEELCQHPENLFRRGQVLKFRFFLKMVFRIG